MTVQIVDCTIRDGGHLNQWRFDPDCVRASYFAALAAGVDFFEVGYRSPKTKSGRGDFSYCDDAFLRGLLQPSKRCKIAIMINASEYRDDLLPCREEADTPVRAVRLAAYPYEIEAAVDMCLKTKQKGYSTFLNLMAFSEISESALSILKKWNDKDILDAVYFADSFGSFTQKDIERCVSILKTAGFSSIGFHSHNNLQMAFANSQKAAELGCTHVDASVYGMGRGAGNLPIEVWLAYLEKTGARGINPVPYLDIIERFYKEMHRNLSWGYSLPTLMSGIKNIHPYYVDNICNRKCYTVSEIWNVLDRVKAACPVSYSTRSLDETLDHRLFKPLSEEEAARRFAEIENELTVIEESDAFIAGPLVISKKHPARNVLILANGPSVQTFEKEIHEFIEKEACITIGVNQLPSGFAPDYHVFVNKRRFLSHVKKVSRQSILVLPSFFGKRLVMENCDKTPVYFNVEMTKDPMDAPLAGDVQRVLHLSVAGSAVLLAYAVGAKEIFIAGMDGYAGAAAGEEIPYFYNEADVPEETAVSTVRYEKLKRVFLQIERFLVSRSVPLSIITPTSHKEYYRDRLNIVHGKGELT